MGGNAMKEMMASISAMYTWNTLASSSDLRKICSQSMAILTLKEIHALIYQYKKQFIFLKDMDMMTEK